MKHSDELRRRARHYHEEVCGHGEDKQPSGLAGEALLAKAESLTGIKRRPLPHGHPLLNGAAAKFERNTIWYDASVEPWLASYYQAHEYAHVWLGHGARSCTASDVDSEAAEDKMPLGIHRVEGYGPHERTECEANVFAREFLLPGNVLKEWFTKHGMNADAIAVKTGMSIEMVCHQLARSLLTPDVTVAGTDKDELSDATDLDKSQILAAELSTGPVLIAAGPGTGKTRTLVGRILYLLNNGVLAESILVLTFSNKAAEELRDRVGKSAADSSQKIRIETFHSFGLELLRKYGTAIGLSPKPVILDPIDALFLLEKSLPQLGLDHYQKLSEPTMYLQEILKAISRAKDENASPQHYNELAQAMLANAATLEEQVAAEKALEVANVYTFYQNYLDKEGLLDFGDLICRSIKLLENNASVRDDVRSTYTQVLVDEYQDVNRASGFLLKLIAGEGEGLWAVGDMRQSIHRWRGATPINMKLFHQDFPNAKAPLHLEINYRSQPPIVDAFSGFVPQMRATAGTKFTPWEKKRPSEGGKVSFEIAADLLSEGKGIAREIKRLQSDNISFRQQAVICRSHTNLARIAALLEKENIPVLYLGDLFERPEVRDMLSLLALACEGDGRGLFRVARFPEYNISLADVRALRLLAQDKGIPFPQALDLAASAETISPHGKVKIDSLNRQIESLCHGRSAWRLLTRYLFVNSKYLDHILSGESTGSLQRRVALYQFLQFAHGHIGRPTEENVDPKLSLLRYIRRLEVYGEERQLRQMPSWADGIDAVRILTVHASKGLEFKAVFLPMLGTTSFPASRQHQSCPPPPGLIETDGDWHEEEEECLFFVALSRARDHLFLSRAVRYGRVNRKPSKFLAMISRHLPGPVDGPITWQGSPEETPNEVKARTSVELNSYSERELDTYMQCPRKYYYESVLGLSGKREDTAYVQFHQCVYGVLRWLQAERARGIAVDTVDGQAQLAVIWNTRGPLGHPYEQMYREKAEILISKAMARELVPGSSQGQVEHEITLTHGRVKLTLNHAEFVGESSPPLLLVRRIRTGRPTKTETDKPIYGLYKMSMERAYPNAKHHFQVLYLSTDETQDILFSQRQIDSRVQKYDDAMLGILRSDFDPQPSDRDCPRCPHYFICPTAED